MNAQPEPEGGSHPVTLAAFNQAAVRLSRIYLGLFLVFCAIVAWIDAPALGWWWIAAVAGGLVAVPVVFVTPVTAVSLLMGAKGGVSPFTVGGRLVYLVLDLAGYVALWFATRWALNALGG